MRGRAHSDETKAAVLAALLAGQGIADTAGTYHLPESTVRQWAKELGPQFAEVRAKKAHDFDALIADYLEEVLVTLAVQVRHFRDVGWLQKQPASEAAVLHGVLTDKAIRILSARVPEEPGAPPEPPAAPA